MHKLVEELKSIVRFKDVTEIGDHVLIVSQTPRIVIYALVISLERDRTRKDEWWHVGMRLLTLPPQTVTWTLREPQFSGKITFTMQGVEHFMKAVDFGTPDGGRPGKLPPESPEKKDERRGSLRIVK